MDSKPVITKETKNKIRVDYEGKLSFKERMMKKIKASNTWITAIVNFFKFILMLGISYVILYPFFAKFAQSFMTEADVIDVTVSLIPKHFTLDIYKTIFVENHYLEAFINTLILSLLCAIIQTFIACLIGYGLAKFKFKGNAIVMGVVILTMIIPHHILKNSMSMLFFNFDLFHVQSWNYQGPIEAIFGEPLMLGNSFWPLTILSVCGLAFKNGLYIYLMRQFFKGVPDELEESAYVDGSGVFRTFFQIIIPLSVPMMITIFLFTFSWQWTDEFYTKLFFVGRNAIHLMPGVAASPDSFDSLVNDYRIVARNTGGMMVIAPLIVLYLFCQRYLVQGIERSGLVG